MVKKTNNKFTQQKNKNVKNTKKPVTKQMRKQNKQKVNNAPKMVAVKKVKINSIPKQINKTEKKNSANKKYVYIAIAAALIVLAFIFI